MAEIMAFDPDDLKWQQTKAVSVYKLKSTELAKQITEVKMKLFLLGALALTLYLPSAFANVGGTDLQNFNPLTNGLDFVTVHSSRTLDTWQINVGGFTNYTHNSLPYSSLSLNANDQSFGNPNDQLLYSNLNLAMGIMRGWDIGVATGLTNVQSIRQPNFLFSYGDKGLNEVRLNSKTRVYSDHDFGLAMVLGVDFEQIKNNPFMGDNAGPTFNFEGVFDWKIAPDILWAVNIGYRLRNPGSNIQNTGVTVMPDQLTYSTALSYITDNWGSAVIGEIYGSTPMEVVTIPTDRQISNLEFLLGYRWQGLENVDIHLGGGSSFYYGLGSPDLRVYLGLNWRIDFFRPSS
jgi:OmpA-OmpF porin, OOP family